MTKEEMKALGITDEAITAILEDQGKNFIPKAKFNEINEAKKNLETQISDRDKQLVDLQKKANGNEDLQKQIEKLQQDNKSQSADYEQKIKTMTIDNIVNTSLSAAKAKNAKAVRAMLQLDSYELDGDKVKGLDDAIANAKKENPWAFEPVEEKPDGASGFNADGFKPGASGDTGNGDNGSGNTVAQVFANAINGKF